MKEPISRPLEKSEANRLSGGDPYRLYVLSSLDEIKEEQKLAARWREEHSLKDALEFQALRNEISKLKDGAVTVQSGINDYEENKQQFIGMRKLVIGIVATIAAIGGGIIGLYEIIKLMSQKP